jgi:hypothetical protein
MQQHEINEIFEAFLYVLKGANEYEIQMFVGGNDLKKAKSIMELVPKAEQYLIEHPCTKPLVIRRR